MKTKKKQYCSKQEKFDHDFVAADKLADRGLKRKAFKMFLKSAKEGNVDCYNTVGVMYSDGDGVKKSDRWALYWLRKALRARPKEFMAFNNIGCVVRDRGDFKAAERWFKKAVNLGDGDAWLNLAKLYLGPLQSKAKARNALCRVIEYTPYEGITEYSQEEAQKLLQSLDDSKNT